jgi:hypothetical protein
MTMSSGDWGANSSEDTERSSSSARDRKRDAAASTHVGRLALLYAMSRGADPEASKALQAALLASATKWISDAGQPPQAGGGGNRHAARGATREVRRGEAGIAPALEDSRGEANRRSTPRTGKEVADKAATSEDRRRETDREATPEARRGEADRRATPGDRREKAHRGANPEGKRGANSQPTRGGTPESREGTISQTNRGITPQVLTGAATHASRSAKSKSSDGSSLNIESDPYTDALAEALTFTQKRIQEAKDDLLERYPFVLVQELLAQELPGDRNLLQIRHKINEANEKLHNLERRLQDLRTGTTNPVEEENRRKRRAITGKIRQVTNQYSDRWVIREKLQQELQRLVGCAKHPDIEDNIWLCTRAIREVSKAIREEDLASWQHKMERGRRQESFRTRHDTATQGNELRGAADSPRGPFAGAEAVSNLTATSPVLGGRAWSRPERPITDKSGSEHERGVDRDDDRQTFPRKRKEKRAKRRSVTWLSMPENAKTGAVGKAKAAAKGKATGKRGAAGSSGEVRESDAARRGAAGRSEEVRASGAARGGAEGARAMPRNTAAAGKNAVAGEDAGPSAAAGGAERRMRGSDAGESLTAGLAAGSGGEIGVGAEGDVTVAESAGGNATALDHAAPPGQAAPPMAHASSAGHGLLASHTTPAEGLSAAGNSGAATAASSRLPPSFPRSPDRGRKRRNPEPSATQ